MFQLQVTRNVLVDIKGSIVTDQGPQDFDFGLLCERLPTSELQSLLSDNRDGSLDGFMRRVVRGWERVRAGDADAPFAPEALDQLLAIPGLPGLAFTAYLEQVGAKAKAKNSVGPASSSPAGG